MSKKTDREVIEKKLENMRVLLVELSRWTDVDFKKFESSSELIRASERNVEILVELASDINAIIIFNHTVKTIDTYRESFEWLEKLGILNAELSKNLIDTVKLRNALVHEYDFELDSEKFYQSIKTVYIQSYKAYIENIFSNISNNL